MPTQQKGGPVTQQQNENNLRYSEAKASLPAKRETFIWLPLTKHWLLGITLRKLREVFQNPLWVHRRFAVSVVSFIVIGAIILFGVLGSSLQAATYSWTQASWAGGVSGTYPNHTSNRTGWTYYSTKDANLTASTNLTLAQTTASTTQTNDTDFNAGTHSSTERNGTGSSAKVQLTSVTQGITQTAVGTNASDAFVSGTKLYITSNAAGLRIYDLTAPTAPSLLSTTDTPNSAIEVVVSGNTAYVNDTTTVQVIDVTNPASPSILTNIPYSNYSIYGLQVVGNYLYVAYYNGGSEYVRVYNITNPASPTFVTAPINGGSDVYLVTGMDLGTNMLYINGYYLDEYDNPYPIIQRIDVTIPASPVVKGTYSTGSSPTGGIVVSGTTVFRAHGNTIQVLSDTNPNTTPTLTATYSTGISTSPKELTLSGTRLYFTQGTAGVIGLDASNPAAMTQVLTQDSAGTAVALRVSGSYIYVADSGSGIASITIPSYSSSGTFTSSIIDTTGNTGYGNLSWTATTPTNTTLTVKMRSSNSATMVGAPDWATCSNVTSGNDITGGCVTDGHRYVQYQAALATSDVNATSSLDDITVQYQQYPTSQTLTSSAYNTGDATNVLGSLQWTQTVPGGTSVKAQIRTAPDSGGSPGAWSSFLGPTGTGDYYTNPAGETLHTTLRDGSGDQWVQYKVWLETTDPAYTPTVDDVVLVYVVNAAPDFQAAPTATQLDDGTVSISYAVRDTDTTSGSVHRGYVTPSFEYTTNGGTNWNTITTGLAAGATTNKAVQEGSYTTYATTWDAKTQIDGTYSTQFGIRVTVSDGEGANNLAQSASGNFTLDVQDPTPGSPALIVNASVSPAALTLSATDNSALEMRISLASDFAGASWDNYSTSATLALATDPDTVYVQFRDAFGNTTATQSVVSPETPANIIIRDITNLDTGGYLLFAAWKTVSIPAPQFSGYRVYRSTDGNTYTLLTTIVDRATNYYVDASVSVDTTYWYKIATVDTSGDISYFSSVVSDTPDGQGGTDRTPPAIEAGSVATTNITTQGATITWNTDELSDSTVGYSTLAGVFTTLVGVDNMVNDPDGVGAHSIVLTNLQPATTYYFKVRSADPSMNAAEDTNGGDGFTFTTLAGPAISNVSTSEVLNTQATITWRTDITADSIVFYSTDADLSNASQVGVGAPPTREHSITLSALTPGTTYYYYVTSGVAVNKNGGAYYRFTTQLDTVGPVISNITVSPITDTQAVVQWVTNERSTGTIRYGTAPGSTSTTSSTGESADLLHSLTLNNLSSDTTYYLTILAADQAGNETLSTETAFTTLEQLSTETEVRQRENDAKTSSDATAPEISAIAVSDITDALAQVTWRTNESANSFVQFGPTTGYGTTYGAWAYDTTHQIQLASLSPSTTYHLRVISADRAGNLTLSSDTTFTTSTATVPTSTQSVLKLIQDNQNLIKSLAGNASIDALEQGLEGQYELIQQLSSSIPSPLIRGTPQVELTASSAVVSWKTDKNANATVAYADAQRYQATNTYPFTAGDTERFTTDHSVTLANLNPDTTYHYQIRSRTPVSDPTNSVDFTFRTPKRNFAIDNYTYEKNSDEQVTFRWTTTEAADATVKVIPYHGNVLAVDEAKIVTQKGVSIIHQVEVGGFASGTVYEISLTSRNSGGNLITQTLGSFTTGTTDAPPIISKIRADTALSPGKTIRLQTVITWTTNEAATSQVFFRKGVASDEAAFPEKSALDANYTRNHVVVLTNFEPGSAYQFQVESTDTTKNTTRSKAVTILTPQQEQTVFQVIMKAVGQSFGWLGVFK